MKGRQVTMAVAVESWGHTSLRRKQLDDGSMGLILQGVKAG
jgi:hypothetical protein